MQKHAIESRALPLLQSVRAATPPALALLSATVLSLLSGCLPGPKYHQPAALATPPPPAYKEAAPPPPSPAAVATGAAPPPAADLKEWSPASPQDAMLRGKWWEIYNDPELNALEEQLNIDNQNIKLFFQNLMVARALVREARSEYYPTVTASPSWSRSRSSSNLGNSSASFNSGQQANLISLPLGVSWEPDLFGRIRNTVHEEQYAAQVSAADLENERLSEQSSLAQFFFEIRGQDALQKVLNDTVEADKKALALTQALYETGVDNQISVVEAQSTLQSAQAAATNVGLLRAQYEHAIATLIGQSASNFSIPVKPMTTAPPPIPIGIPSQLLERRPDIAGAERSMASANAAIGVAYSAFFPTVTLGASGGFESATWKHLFDIPSRVWSIGPSISQPIFNAGLTAGLSQFVSTYNADVATYRQTVLSAFQQVEDFLVAVKVYSRQIQQQQEAVASAQKALDLELGRYQTGIDPYIDVVTLQTTLLGDQQALTTLQVEQMASSVTLIQALGGGWDRTQLATPQQVTQRPPKADAAMVH
ncbi:efflux transporter outer membrane subunit [Acidisarcina polymorpha]|nr:efflux transporter outer membrane subunit [Acidisarcina polymorpha]